MNWEDICNTHADTRINFFMFKQLLRMNKKNYSTTEKWIKGKNKQSIEKDL